MDALLGILLDLADAVIDRFVSRPLKPKKKTDEAHE